VLGHDRGGDLVTPLLNALGDDPAGAVAFARAHPPRQLASLFKGASTRQQAAYLAFLRADMLGDPQQADSLLSLAKSLLITYPEGHENQPDQALLTVTTGGFDQMSPQVAAFLHAYLSVKTGTPSRDLTKWDDRITGALGDLAPFYSAALNTGTKENLDFEKSSEWAKAFMTTVLLAGGIEIVPEVEVFDTALLSSERLAKIAKVASTMANGGPKGGLVFAVEPTITHLIFGGGEEEGEDSAHVFRHAMERYVQLTVAAGLTQGGYVRRGLHGPRVSWDRLTDHRGLEGLNGKIDDMPEEYWVVYPDSTQMPLRLFLKTIRVPD
jgi:hypothetical protein